MAAPNAKGSVSETRIAQHTSLGELFHLLDRAVDGIDGIESEEGADGLSQFCDVSAVERAREVIDAVKRGPPVWRA